jgi:hypothetical protein
MAYFDEIALQRLIRDRKARDANKHAASITNSFGNFEAIKYFVKAGPRYFRLCAELSSTAFTVICV